jgi:hypothetical protein
MTFEQFMKKTGKKELSVMQLLDARLKEGHTLASMYK